MHPARWTTTGLLIATLAGCSTGGEAVPAPADLSITGTLTVPGSEFEESTNVYTCVADAGYDDIHKGTDVIVTDPEGTVIAKGQLEGGPRATGGCIFSVSIPDVPTGHRFYGIEISHRGKVTYGREELEDPVELSLG